MRRNWSPEHVMVALRGKSVQELVEIVDTALQSIECMPVVTHTDIMKQMEQVRKLKQNAAKQVYDVIKRGTDEKP